MINEIFIYPAIFSYAKDGISIEFPDLPGCLSCAEPDNDLEAVKNASEALALHLSSLEDDGEDLPVATSVSKIKVKKNQTICMIEVWMPYHRALIKTAYVKKTLTIPNWLNVLAEHNKVNFSATLQEALIQKLGIETK